MAKKPEPTVERARSFGGGSRGSTSDRASRVRSNPPNQPTRQTAQRCLSTLLASSHGVEDVATEAVQV